MNLRPKLHIAVAVVVPALVIALFNFSRSASAQLQNIIEVGKFSAATVGQGLPDWLETPCF